MMLQIARRMIQISVILLIVVIPWLCLYAHYRAARVVDDEQLMAGMRGEVITQAIHPYLDELEHPEAFLDANKGTVWSMRLAGYDIADPLAAVEMLAASKSIHWPLWLSVLVPVILTLILGKVFCSWICPGYLLFELAGKIRPLLKFAEIPPAEVKFSHKNKYIFLFVGLGITAMFSLPLFALIYPPAVISRALHAWVFGTALTGMLVVLGTMLLVEILISPRWWCQTMCPGGALYGLLGKKRLLRVKLKSSSCTGCQACIPVCEAGINPITQSGSIECDNCGVCLRHCDPAALVFTIGLPTSKNTGQPQHNSKTSNRPAAAMLTLAFWLLWATPVSGHHVLGLPHYSYKENYPQRPTLEYPATTGPYDVLLTSYPGTPTPGEPANLAFYIKNRNTGKVFTDRVKICVLQTSTFGDNVVILPTTERASFDNEHKLQCTFPVDAEYIVELTLVVEGKQEVIPFLLNAGEPTATASIVVAGVSTLLFCFVVVRAVQKKYQRRKLAAQSSSGGQQELVVIG